MHTNWCKLIQDCITYLFILIKNHLRSILAYVISTFTSKQFQHMLSVRSPQKKSIQVSKTFKFKPFY